MGKKELVFTPGLSAGCSSVLPVSSSPVGTVWAAGAVQRESHAPSSTTGTAVLVWQVALRHNKTPDWEEDEHWSGSQSPRWVGSFLKCGATLLFSWVQWGPKLLPYRHANHTPSEVVLLPLFKVSLTSVYLAVWMRASVESSLYPAAMNE